MTDVVIVEAVRTPVGKRNGGLSTVHPADLLATVQKAAIERSGIDPAAVGQVVTGCVSQVGEQAFNIGRTAWLSAGLPAHRGQHHRRHAVRLVAAGHQPGHRPRRQRGRRLRPRRRRRGDEPGADRLERPQGPRPRHPDPEVVLPAVRDDLAVRGRRAHRRQVGHLPRRHRRLRPPLPGERRQGVGRGSLRHADHPGGGARRRRGGPAHRLHPHGHPRRGPARDQPREARPSSSPWPGPTACTPRARRRRSPTVPPPCS